VDSWWAFGFAADSGVVAEPPEVLLDELVDQSGSGHRDEEARGGCRRTDPIASPGVGVERGECGRVHGNQSGFAELRLSDRQYRIGPVEIAAIEPDRFPDPQADYRQQPDQGFVGLSL
jgi:hypothetical protein